MTSRVASPEAERLRLGSPAVRKLSASLQGLSLWSWNVSSSFYKCFIRYHDPVMYKIDGQRVATSSCTKEKQGKERFDLK